MNEAISLVALAASLTAAVARWRRAPDWVVAAGAAVVVVLVGALAALLLPPTAGSSALPLRAVAVYLVLLFAVLATPVLLGPLGRVAGLRPPGWAWAVVWAIGLVALIALVATVAIKATGTNVSAIFTSIASKLVVPS